MIDSGIIEEAAEQLPAAATEDEAERIIGELITEVLGLGCVHTFEEAGIMTRNRGLVIRAPESGSEFQLTIVQSA